MRLRSAVPGLRNVAIRILSLPRRGEDQVEELGQGNATADVALPLQICVAMSARYSGSGIHGVWQFDTMPIHQNEALAEASLASKGSVTEHFANLQHSLSISGGLPSRGCAMTAMRHRVIRQLVA